jgi:hypothetical protein
LKGPIRSRNLVNLKLRTSCPFAGPLPSQGDGDHSDVFEQVPDKPACYRGLAGFRARLKLVDEGAHGLVRLRVTRRVDSPN